MPKSMFIVSGPEDKSNIPKESMGKYFFNCLKHRKRDMPINIDVVTGEISTNGQILVNSVKLVKIFENLQLKSGDVIALMSENNLSFCLPILSSLYMGITVTCLNPSYSPGEIKHALNISKPKLIISSKAALPNLLKAKDEVDSLEAVLLLGSASENHSSIKNINDLLETVSVDIDSYEPQDFDPTEQGALIMMSSGTTGLPKGVLLTHQNLRISLIYMRHADYLELTPEETIIIVVPFFHICGFLLEIGSIAYGAKALVVDRFKPNIFLQAIQDYQVTKLIMVPPLLDFLGKSPLVENYNLSSVKDFLCGGAPVSKEIQDVAIKRFQVKQIRQIYGMTETCGATNLSPTYGGKFGSTGILIPGASAKISNLETNEIVGPWEVGELCFKGSMVMKGYIQNDTETQNCIDEDEFYHSGDIGYYDEDGYFYIIDRVKELIKYKGFQVPPAELEALLVTHPAVKDCGVIGIRDERAGQVPLAFVVRQNNTTVTEQDIIDFVAERISVQKHLYGGVKFVDEIPRTASGKILRRTLQEIFKTTS